MEDLSELKLKSMNIYDLRQVAKDLGVPKPTTYKKEELVSMVKMFLADEASTDKKARESKAINKRIDEEKLKQEVKKLEKKKLQLKQLEEERLRREGLFSKKEETIIPQNPSNKDNEYSFTFKNSPVWRLSDNRVDKKFRKEEGKVLAGYYYKDNNGNSFILPQGNFKENETVFVKESSLSSLDIRQGDFVECIYKTTPQQGRVLTDIDNELEFDNRPFYDSLKRVYEKPKGFSIDQTIKDSFVDGSRNIIRISDFSLYNDIVKSFKSLPKKYTFVQYDIDALPEFNLCSAENFYTLIGEKKERINFIAGLMINRIKRLVERKQKVVILVDEITKLVKFCNLASSYNAYDIKTNSLLICKEIMNLAGTYENGASVTVIALFRKKGFGENDNYLENEFLDMNCYFSNLED